MCVRPLADFPHTANPATLAFKLAFFMTRQIPKVQRPSAPFAGLARADYVLWLAASLALASTHKSYGALFICVQLVCHRISDLCTAVSTLRMAIRPSLLRGNSFSLSEASRIKYPCMDTEKATPARHRPERQYNARANRRKQCSPNETISYSNPTPPRKRQNNPTNACALPVYKL